MPNVVGCKFRGSFKVYYFAPANVTELLVNDQVIVDTSRGREMAQIVNPPKEVEPGEIVGELKPIIRHASPADLLDMQHYQSLEEEAVVRCKEQVAKSGLPMKIVNAEYAYDGSSLTFFFTAEQRVDFRELVRELARIFRTRIDLRQVGVRDEAKVVGGVGKCGRPLCCATWLPEFYPVSIRMAKAQDLPLSPMEISGCCGRLLCCLSYENDQYAEIKSHFPKVGKTVQLACGPVKVLHVHALREMATVLLEDGTVRMLSAEQLAGNAPLECEEPDDQGQEEPHDALDGVLATLGDKALESLGTRQAAAITQGNRQQPRQDARTGSEPPQQRSTSAPHQQERPVQQRETSPAEGASSEPVEKRRRRRGGRRHPRRNNQSQPSEQGNESGGAQ